MRAATELAPYNKMGTALVAYDQMCAAIDAAHSVVEVKDIRDRAIVLRDWAHRAKNKDLEDKVTRLRIKAERTAGRMLAEDKKTGLRAGPGHTKQPNRISSASDIRRTLADYGISLNQSSAWQKIAAIPEARFQAALKAKAPQTAIRLASIRNDRSVKQAHIAMEKGAGRGPWAVVYADPPWKYGARPLSGISAPYAELPQEKIESFLIDREIKINDRAVLFLWATIPLLPQGLAVLKAWGFEYKHAIAWDKGRGLPGHYFQGHWEILLVGYRGKFPPPAITNLPNLLSIKRGPHSAKPEEFADMIERLYPDFDFDKRLELFARRRAFAWTTLINGKFKLHAMDVLRLLTDTEVPFATTGSLRSAAIAKYGEKKWAEWVVSLGAESKTTGAREPLKKPRQSRASR